jgi:hypothetical protein
MKARKKTLLATVKKGNNIQAIQLDEEHFKELVTASVAEAFVRIGLNYDEPTELQKDMAYLRSWRLLVQSSGRRAWFAVLGVMLVVTLSAFAIGLGIPAKFLGILTAAKTP